MNREVHYDFTRRWARDEGFSAEDAETVAAANWACDVNYTDLAGKRYHWPLLGAPLVSVRRFRRAVRKGDLVALGEAMHSLQDTIGHGLWGHFHHWHGIDRWQHRSLRVRHRLETHSRAMLSAYRTRRGLPAEPAGVPIPVLECDQAELIATLNEVAEAVSSEMSVDAMLDAIVDRAKSITDTDKALLILTGERSQALDRSTLVVRGSRGQHAQDWWERRLDALGESAFAAGEPVAEIYPAERAVILACPLHTSDRPVGLLCAINSEDRPFTQEQVHFAHILSAFAAAAIENARLAEMNRYVLLASERDRIAREMHDGVVQSLFSISLGLEVCKKQVSERDPETAARLGELQAHLNTSMTELRRFIYDLRPMKLTELGFVGATEYWVREVTAGTPIRGSVEVEGDLPPLEPSKEACLYRVAKEAVSNVVRHSTAQTFRVRVESGDTMITLLVIDDGSGFDAAAASQRRTRGLGLESIRECVAGSGGTVSVESEAGHGTVLRVDLPLWGTG